MKKILVDGDSLGIEDVVMVSRYKREVELPREVIDRLDESRRFVEEIIRRGKPVYGVNTGVGELCNTRIEKDKLTELQKNIIYSHAILTPPYLSKESTRGTMLLRANSLAKGYSGVRKEIIERLLFFLNNDAVVDKNCLIEAVKTLLKDDKIAICGSKVISLRDPTIQYGGGFLHYMGGAVYIPLTDRELKMEFLPVGSICGASFLIRKKVFQEVNGFDNNYFLYSDEVDLCHRVWLAGYYVVFCPKSVAYHYGGGTAGKLATGKHSLLASRLSSPLRAFYGNRNSLINIIKNFELKNVFLGMLFSFFLFLLQLAFILRKLEVKYIKLLIKAYIWPIRNLKLICKKRVFIQAKRKLKDSELVKKNICLSLSSLIRLVLRHG